MLPSKISYITIDSWQWKLNSTNIQEHIYSLAALLLLSFHPLNDAGDWKQEYSVCKPWGETSAEQREPGRDQWASREYLINSLSIDGGMFDLDLAADVTDRCHTHTHTHNLQRRQDALTVTLQPCLVPALLFVIQPLSLPPRPCLCKLSFPCFPLVRSVLRLG